MISLFCKNCEFVFSSYENAVYQNVELLATRGRSNLIMGMLRSHEG